MAKKTSDKIKVSDIKDSIEEVKAIMAKYKITDNNYIFTADGPRKLEK